MKKINTTLFFVLICCMQSAFAQVTFNPFTQNIHFDPEPTSIGFLCGSNQSVIFTQGLTTADDAILWQTSPLTVTICIGGFEFNGTAASVVSGSYANNFDWAFASGSSTCMIGTQNQVLYGTGTNPLFPNPLSSGIIELDLKVPNGLATSTPLTVDVTLQVPAYMNAFNSTPDDNESTQTQSFCGCNPITTAGIISSNQTYCKNADPYPFVSLDSASGGSGGAIQYQWQVYDGTGWIDIAGATDSTYDAGFILETHQYRRNAKRSDCLNWISSNIVTVIINPLPIADAGNDQSIAPGLSAQIGSPSIMGNSYSWLPTSGLSASNIADPIATPLVTTTYTLTVTSSLGCVEIDSVTIHINSTPPPPPTIVAYPNKHFCFGEHIVLTAYGEPGSSFDWTLPPGATATIDNSHSGISMVNILSLDAASNGEYIVSQTVSGYPVSQSDTIVVDGGEKPIINFITTSCVSNNGEVTVDASGSSSLEYSINGGMFQSSNLLQTSPGSTFIVAVKNANSSCVSYYEGHCVYCTAPGVCSTIPTDSIVGPSMACVNSQIHLSGYFNNASQGMWSSSGTGTFTSLSSTNSPSHTIYSPSASDLLNGHVVITFTTNDPDGSGPCRAAICSKNIIIIDRVVSPNVHTNSPVCANTMLTLSATGAIGNIAWDGPNWFAETGNQISIPNIDTSMSGVFIAIASVSGCMNAPNDNLTYVNVVVIPSPNLTVGAFGYPESCYGNGNGTIHVDVSGGSGNYSICYNGALSNCDTNSTTIFHWITPGMYTVSVVDQQCPNNTFTYPVQVAQGAIIPAPVISPALNICEGEPIVLSGNVSYPASTILWVHGPTLLNATGNPLVLPNATPSMSGSYYAKALDINGCASSQVQININVYEKPIIQHVETICNGISAEITITAISTLGNLLYSLDGINYQASNKFVGMASGNYMLHVKNSISSCETELPVLVQNCACPLSPIVHINSPIRSCLNTPIPIIASFTNVSNSLLSSSGTGSFSVTNGSSPISSTYTPSTADLSLGYVYLTLTTDDPDGSGPCTPISETVYIALIDSLQTPIITTSKPTYCEGDTVVMNVDNINSTINWSGVGGYFSNGDSAIIYSVSQSMSGNYSATVTGNGCISKSSTYSLTIASPPNLLVTSSVTPEGCEFQANGAIHVEVSGGSGNYMICNITNPTCYTTNQSADFKWLAPATYMLKISDAICPNYWVSTSETVSAGLHVDPPISVNSPSVCEGENLIMTVTNPSTGNFIWTDISNNISTTGQGIMKPNATIEMSGPYKVQQLIDGCASSAFYVDALVNGIPTITSVDTFCTGTGEDSGRIVINSIVNGNSAIEYSINNSAYQTSPIFNHLKNGLYSVKARTVGSDCESNVQTIDLYCACNCGKENSISVFPNPNNGTFTLNSSLTEPSDHIGITMFDITGKVIYQKIITDMTLYLSEVISIKQYANGNYIIRVDIDGEIYLLPVAIKQ